ncbi:MAG: hypothetical protein L3J49_02770 [Desulfobulbaceae bacterium]|nr:hypothetical protein [Desulfobulbaceae bacterium]
MISYIGRSPASMYTAQVQSQNRPSAVPAGAQEAFAIDLDKLFTPSERKTIENLKEYSKSQGMSQKDIEAMEAIIVTSKDAEKSISHDISIKEILGRQIRGIQDGYGKNNGPSLASLQNVYDNLQMLQGTELFA